MLRLVIANLNYSSWSMRPWLALEHAGAPFSIHDVGLKTRDGWKQRILDFSGAGKVPILVDGALSVHESLAICETVNELFPEARLWPAERALRARGRAISAEMASSFLALRSRLPTNLRGRAVTRPILSEAVQADVTRIVEIWSASLEASGGPYLLGEFSIADCMYFPVATRFRTYDIEVPELARRYMTTLFDLAPAKKLEQLALSEPSISEYDAFLTAN